jgi:hypothetical protein
MSRSIPGIIVFTNLIEVYVGEIKVLESVPPCVLHDFTWRRVLFGRQEIEPASYSYYDVAVAVHLFAIGYYLIQF